MLRCVQQRRRHKFVFTGHHCQPCSLKDADAVTDSHSLSTSEVESPSPKSKCSLRMCTGDTTPALTRDTHICLAFTQAQKIRSDWPHLGPPWHLIAPHSRTASCTIAASSSPVVEDSGNQRGKLWGVARAPYFIVLCVGKDGVSESNSVSIVRLAAR